MTDVTKAIEAKSDQLNADDLLTGPRVIVITKVDVNINRDQKVWIYYEGDSGKPWKPCKTATRILAHFWGADSSRWVGLSLEIWRDPEVLWGGAKVGGIMPSKLEGLKTSETLFVTKTRGKKIPVVIKPLSVVKKDKPSTDKQPIPPQSSTAQEVNRDQLKADMEKYANDPDGKRDWWAGLNASERAAVKELASEAQ